MPGQWTTCRESAARLSYQRGTPPLRPIRERWISASPQGTVYGLPIVDAREVTAQTADVTGDGAVTYLLRGGRLGGVGHVQAQLAACSATGGDACLASFPGGGRVGTDDGTSSTEGTVRRM